MTTTNIETNTFEPVILMTEFKYFLTRLLRKANDADGDASDFFLDDINADTKEQIMFFLREYRTITTEEVCSSDTEAVMYLALAGSNEYRKDQKISLHVVLVRPWGMYHGIAHADEWRIKGWWSGWRISSNAVA